MMLPDGPEHAKGLAAAVAAKMRKTRAFGAPAAAFLEDSRLV
jgi:hypothetical protein